MNCCYQLLVFRHILFSGNEVGDLTARIPHRGDGHLFGVKASVLSPVDELTLPGISLGEWLPKAAGKTPGPVCPISGSWGSVPEPPRDCTR